MNTTNVAPGEVVTISLNRYVDWAKAQREVV